MFDGLEPDTTYERQGHFVTGNILPGSDPDSPQENGFMIISHFLRWPHPLHSSTHPPNDNGCTTDKFKLTKKH